MKRILLKLSGEALAGEKGTGFDEQVVTGVAKQVKVLVDEGMALGWNRYWNEDNMDRDSRNYVSGLLGPVRLLHVISPKP